MESKSKQICKFFTKGACKNGDSCKFAHPQQTQTNSIKKESTQVCQYFLKGKCTYGDKCRNSHKPDPQQYNEQEYQKLLVKRQKQRVCQPHIDGYCSYGQKCYYKHLEPQDIQIQLKSFEDNIKIPWNKDLRFVENILETKLDQKFQHQINEEAQLVLIRHGLSNYNYQLKMFVQLTDFTAQDEQAKIFQFEQSLIDSPLHEIGILQAQNSQKYINKIHFHTVFVSPMNRAIQTCEIMFLSHPNKNNIKFVVLPLVSEFLSKIQDIAQSELFNQFKQKFENIDNWDLTHLKDENWQIDELKDHILKNRLIQHMQQHNLTSQQSLIQFLKKSFPQPIEEYTDVFNRFYQYISHYQFILKELN